jgi:hypothetical protein
MARKSLEGSQLVQDVGDKLSLCIRPMVMYRIFNSTHIRLCPVIIFCLHQGAIVYISFKLPRHYLAIKVWVSPKKCYYSHSLKGGIQFINPLFISTCINNAFCPNNFPPKSISAEICQGYIVTASNIVLFWTINTRLFLNDQNCQALLWMSRIISVTAQ